MADVQRQLEREERKLRKEKKRKIILWSIAGIIVIMLVIMRVCEININSVIDRFTDNEGNISLLEGVADDNFPYSVDSSKNVIMTDVNNKLGVLTPGSFTVINASDGSTDYVFEHGYSNPVLERAGIYTLVYDQGAKNYRLDTTNSLVYQKTSEASLLCAIVNKKGSVAVATNTSAKHCSITMYKESLSEVMSVDISDGYVVDMALSDNGRRLAVVTVNSVNASLITTVTIYNTSSQEKLGSVALPSGSVIDVHYSGYSLYALGDSYLGIVDDDAEYTEVFKLGDISTICYDYSNDDELVLVYGQFSNSSANICSVIDDSGDIDASINIKSTVKDISASSNRIIILTPNKLFSYYYDGDLYATATCNDSVKSVCALGSYVYSHHQSLIEKGEVTEE